MPHGRGAAEPLLTTFARTKDAGAAWVAEPLIELTRKEYIEDRVPPFRNPYQAYGTPLAVNMQSQIFYSPDGCTLDVAHAANP